MFAHRIEFESESIQYEDAMVTLHKIKSTDTAKGESFMHTHSYFELLLAVEDSDTCHTLHGDIQIGRGELLIIQPALSHRTFGADQDGRLAALGLEVTAPHGKGRFYEFFMSFLQTKAGKPITLRQSVFHKFLQYYAAPPRRTVRQLCERKREACEVLSALWELADGEENGLSNRLSTAPDIILETLVNSKEISLSEIAVKLGYSQRQIQRKIRERYGKCLREIRGGKK